MDEDDSATNRGAIPPARAPMPWRDPELHRGESGVMAMVVREYASSRPTRRTEQLHLVRAEPEHVQQGYRLYARRPSIRLGGMRGKVIFCQILPRIRMYNNNNSEQKPALSNTDVVFEEPTEPRFVAIKMLRRSRIPAGDIGNDNPYNEISAMQNHGDARNMIHCIEALTDNNYLYIVMPCEQGGDLHSHIPWKSNSNYMHPQSLVVDGSGGLNEPQARFFFSHIIRNMEYLQQNCGACHRDLKGENILVDATSGETKLIDLAMSLLVPQSAATNLSNNHHHYLIEARGTCGTLSFMAPEILRNETFDGFAVDVWAMGVILFNLLTGQRLYDQPCESDVNYGHFIVENGLTNDALNREWLQKGRHLLINDPTPISWLPNLLEKVERVMGLTREARSFLAEMLQPDIEKRVTLQQVRGNPWMQLQAHPGLCE